MRSLVLDQSTRNTGYSVVEESPTEQISPGFPGRLISHGLIIPAKADNLSLRIMTLVADTNELIRAYDPDELIIEDTRFKQRNAATSNALGAVFVALQGVAEANGLAFYTQNPGTIKRIIAGKGSADKDEVIAAVCKHFGMRPFQIKDDNHADSLAAAFVWLFMGADIRAKRHQAKKKK